MCTLLDDIDARTEHGGSFARAQVLLFQQHIGDTILLRHLAELACECVVHVLRGKLCFGRRVVSLQIAGFGDIARRAELFRPAPPVAQSCQIDRARNCEGPMQRIRAGDVGRPRDVSYCFASSSGAWSGNSGIF